MIVLGLEFSTHRRSAALVRREPRQATGALLGVASDESGPGTGPLRLVQSVLDQAALPRSAVEAVVIGLGPGSYTGIRSSLSLAQGWHLANGVKVAGVSSVACLAAQAQAKGWFGRIRIVIDAQRGDLYIATYQLSPMNSITKEPLRLVGAADLDPARAEPDTLWVGPEATKCFAHGRILLPEAQTAAGIAEWNEHGPAPEELEPIYLRQTSFVKAPPARQI